MLDVKETSGVSVLFRFFFFFSFSFFGSLKEKVLSLVEISPESEITQ